jgi:2-polyprenyl-3-methyl-5-hydroxy-6-metoxy-1,4-benzoquinol methylase
MNSCRFCKSKNAIKILDLGKIPLSNNFIKQNQIIHTKKYNLEIFICYKCLLVQTKDVVNKNKIFNKDYLYHSSFSKSWLEHSKNLALNLIKKFNLNKSTQVLEIASNDGYLLNFFQKKKIPCIGIEPSASVAKIAKKKRIKTYINFFNKELANKLIKKKIIPKIIIALNVLAHTPNLTDFVRGIKVLIQKKGICVIEFPHVINLIKKFQFDTIYHEHFSYFSLHAIINIFKKNSMNVFSCRLIPTHGGSLRVYIKLKENSDYKIENNVNQILSKENKIGINRISFYNNFNKKIERIKKINKKKIDILSKNKKLIGYGAAAKSTIFCNVLELNTNHIKFIVDKNKFKINRFIPGCNIPILDVKNIKKFKPDYILIFPWNLKNEIINQLKFTRKWNAKFLICNPTLRVLN